MIVHARSFQRQRQVQRRLSAELHDHADSAPPDASCSQMASTSSKVSGSK